ncbi:MAG: MATE family efflux transporter [Clostridia bacterium]|nr:MATE family efflux transporter [Clostridia bacterium]
MAAVQSDFSQGSVKKLILSQALPLTVAQTVQLLYNIVDRIYIGHLEGTGDLALTGLGITFPVIVIIAAFTALFGTGGSTLFAIARGRGDKEEAENVMGNVFSLLTVSAVVLFFVCYFFRRDILFLFGASEDSFVYADQYLRIYLFGTAFSMLSTGLNGYINAQGFPRIGMLTTVLGAAMNVVLDPIFIFVFDMGVRGAAAATVISQALSCGWVLRFLTGKKAVITLRRRSMRLSKDRLRNILSLGFPGFVMQGTNSLVSIACNTQLQKYGGDNYVAIMTVTNSIREMLFVPSMGITRGAQPILGYNYGAKKFGRVKEGIRFAATVDVIYLLVAWITVMLIPRALMGLFTDNVTVVEQGARMLNIYFFGFVFMALQASGQTTFQALGKAKQAIFFSLLRKAIIVVPLTFILPAAGFGVEGVFLAEPVSNVIGGVAAFTTMWFMIYRKL